MNTNVTPLKFSQYFDDAFILEIKKVGKLASFKVNDIIIDIGQPLKYIPLLLSGTIKVLREDLDGNELLIYFLEAGETCTMSLTCCMGTTKSRIRAVAEQDASLLMIPVEKIKNWFHNNENWRNFILESYQNRFEEMLQAIDSLAFMKMDERVLQFLISKSILHNSKVLKIKHQEIAEDLHTSRVVVSRLLKQLEKQGKIVLNRNKITLT